MKSKILCKFEFWIWSSSNGNSTRARNEKKMMHTCMMESWDSTLLVFTAPANRKNFFKKILQNDGEYEPAVGKNLTMGPRCKAGSDWPCNKFKHFTNAFSSWRDDCGWENGDLNWFCLTRWDLMPNWQNGEGWQERERWCGGVMKRFLLEIASRWIEWHFRSRRGPITTGWESWVNWES